MISTNQPNYQVYRGLQKPLVFKSFKGQYIYWGLGSILFALLTAMLVASLVNILAGIISMAIILGLGLGATAFFQHRGVKGTFTGIALIPNNPIVHEQ
jgi:hypothetical protein